MTEVYHADANYSGKVADMIDGAEKRVLLETMNFDNVGEMEKIVAAALDARKRGIEVKAVYDRYSYPSIMGSHGIGALGKFRRTLNTLRDHEVTLYEVGKRELNPFAGRNHAKVVITDDTVLMGGGINLSHVSFETKDFMFRYDDKMLADSLYDQLPEAALSRPQDAIIHISDQFNVLLDGGNKDKSLIYDETCALAEQAAKVWYVSKLAPDGRLLDILQTKDTQYWFNTIGSAANFDKIAIAIDQFRNGSNVVNRYRGRDVLHAKFCVFEDDEGNRSAMSGSHNFNSRGVKFGTQELAVLSFDPRVCQELIDFATALPGDTWASAS